MLGNRAELSENQSYRVNVVNKNQIETNSIVTGASERPSQLSPVVNKNGSIKGMQIR